MLACLLALSSIPDLKHTCFTNHHHQSFPTHRTAHWTFNRTAFHGLRTAQRQWLNCSATGGGSLFLILGYTVRCSKFFTFSGSDLSNGKKTLITPCTLFLSSARVQCTQATRKPWHNTEKLQNTNLYLYIKICQIR